MSFNRRILSPGATPFVNDENFRVVLYTGNGGTQSITGVGFKPDFVWLKNRSQDNYAPRVFDSSRGATKRLQSSSTSAESTDSTSLTSFDADGFTLGADNYVNNNGDSFVAWCWKAGGGTTTSNSDGEITVNVQANQDAGFSIVTFAGISDPGDDRSFGHGLSKEPEFIWMKRRESSQHPAVFAKINGGWEYFDGTSSTDGGGDYDSYIATTSTVVDIHDVAEWFADPSSNYVYWMWHSVDNYSKIGSYVGTGSATDRPIIETGFEPAFVMIKNVTNSGSAGSWMIHDNKRNTANPRDKYLRADSTNAEGTYAEYGLDFLSNGFQVGPTTAYHWNTSGDTYLYMAFAANPDEEAPTLSSSFNTEIYKGTGIDGQAVTGLGFKPGLIWIKNRGLVRDHNLADIVQGPLREITPNTNEAVENRSVKSFDSDGFTLDNSSGNYNANNSDYVTWAWAADDNEPKISGGEAISVYKFEDNANDVAGNYNGTASNVSYVTGKFGKAADFNGTNSTFTFSNSIYDHNSDHSVSFWLNPDTYASDEMIYWGEDDNIRWNSNGTILYKRYSNAAGNRSCNSTTVLSAGTWYHIVSTYSTVLGMRLYVNGELEAVHTGTQNADSTSGDYGIMHRVDNNSYHSDGQVDQLRIYRGVVSDRGVKALYAEGTSDNDNLFLGGPPEIVTSVNANAGFSIVRYGGDDDANRLIPHGLSAAPEMIMLKNLNATRDWIVWHTGLSTGKNLALNSNTSEFTVSTGTSYGGLGTPTATAIKVIQGTSNLDNVNDTGANYMSYNFHSVTGYSKFGTYTGNGSATGPSVTTGFKVDWLMIKRIDGSNSWAIHDSRRVSANPKNEELFANLNDAENEFDAVDFLSNGFQIKNSNNVYNASSASYLYWAVAKNVPSNTTLANSFKTVTYTGNSSSQSITGLGFKPDFIWMKRRSSSQEHALVNAVSGVGKYVYSDLNSAEGNDTNSVRSFDSDGWTMGSNGLMNYNSNTYVAWCWKAGNTWESNLDGSIPSTVNANTANGFSIIKYTGTSASSQSVGHGLNSTPELIMIKNLEATEGWIVWGTGFGTSNWLELNSNAAYNQDNAGWGGTHSSTVVNLQDNGAARSSANGKDYIAYCWHSVSGYSSIGTYTGNGSTTGPTVTTGFQPDFLLVKDLTNSSTNWRIVDSVRGTDATDGSALFPNLDIVEQTDGTQHAVEFQSNGFQIRNSTAGWNNNSATHIYMAFKMN